MWTKALECYSTPFIYRVGSDTDWKNGNEQGKNKYAKYEITHKTYDVKYGINFSSTYSTLKGNTTASSVK